ncbi:MAG: hypothetical protein P0116_13350 [Candidatus Nitrosocosmicus sp.]|nr:hypothetical protein [Candidatus Nitrosocosmicus sp.]
MISRRKLINDLMKLVLNPIIVRFELPKANPFSRSIAIFQSYNSSIKKGSGANGVPNAATFQSYNSSIKTVSSFYHLYRHCVISILV